jgi:23S rRNA pseudouridine1911/1915/1917 synthase
MSISRLEDQIEILYEDNHLLGVYKPAGMLTQGDKTGDLSLLDWAKGWIKDRYGKPGKVFLGLVHRLDRPVAGVVLFARTSKAASRLSAQIRDRTMKKIYQAVVHGSPHPLQGESELYLARIRNKSTVTGPHDPSGQLAVLHYRVIEIHAAFSLVEVTLVTGRHHQIRCQLAALGHPILGDLKYGSRQALPSQAIALVSKQLTCRHPTRDIDVVIESPIPKNWPWPPSSG